MSELFSNNSKLILASASPRRQQFLQELGLEFSIVIAENAEPKPEKGEAPEAYATRAASAKSLYIAKNNAHDAVILAADTVVSIEGEILGKPKDSAEALQMLKKLAGKEHMVISAVSLIFPQQGGGKYEELCFHECTEVCFHPWAEAVLASYASCGEPLDKAGAYAIQGKGAFLVKHIKGSWSNVVGLPVTKLVDVLFERNIIKVR